MPITIRRAAVLGSGVMGAQIAAHLAAAGVRVHLLDLPSDKPPTDPKLAAMVGKNFRNAVAMRAMDNLKSLKPSPLMHEGILQNIIPGNFDDDFNVLSDVDWVVEAVVERIDIKRSILKKICEHARTDIPITTNTSGISLADMSTELPEHFKSRFFGTHFFNPPRYMYLVEIVGHDDVDQKLMRDVSTWIEERLGKGIVFTQDTVNFIANRVGVYTIQATLKHMEELDLNVETVDALTGKLMGRPSSATLRTMDVVGLDTFAHVARNVYDRATDDPYRDYFKVPSWIAQLIEGGSFGQKSGGVGCYKKAKSDKGETVILAYRPKTKTYEPQTPQEPSWLKEASSIRSLPERYKFIMKQDDAAAKFVWRILRDTFSYSALLLTDIADGQVKALDDAIKWGFNWDQGPFEIWQGIGVKETVERMKKEGSKLPAWLTSDTVFYKPTPQSPEWQKTGPTEQYNSQIGKHQPIARPKHQLNLPKMPTKDDARIVLSNGSASLLDLGDRIGCLVFHSKMNALDMDSISMIQKSVEKTSKQFDGLVIGNDADHFSAGANLKYMLELIMAKNFGGIETMLKEFQGALVMLKYAGFPSVSCPHGLTLGGGCEVSLHTSARIASGETYTGLVEAGVGLIPAGGGTKELALRAYEMTELTERGDPMAFLQRAFLLIAMGKTSTSGFETTTMGLYPSTTSVSLSRAHQIYRAKLMAREMADRGYIPPTPKNAVKVVGDPGIQTFKLMLYNMTEGRQISKHDALVAEKTATVLCGGEIDPGQTISEADFLELERRVFIELCQTPKTVERIEYMLKNGKPLRN